jgi:hypothetical protein
MKGATMLEFYIKRIKENHLKYLQEKKLLYRLKVTEDVANCVQILLYDIADKLEGKKHKYSLDYIESVRDFLTRVTSSFRKSNNFVVPETKTIQ